jgi:hypothetical protein
MKKKVLFLVVLTVLLSVVTLGQTRMVSGLVTDESGAVIPGASIVNKMSSQATVSDVFGKYSIRVTGDEDILQFAFIGMELLEVKVGKRTGDSKSRKNIKNFYGISSKAAS